MADAICSERTSAQVEAVRLTPEDIATVSGGMLLVRAAAKHSGISRTRLFALMAAGELPYAVLDDRGARAIPKVKLDEYLARLLVATRLMTSSAHSGKDVT